MIWYDVPEDLAFSIELAPEPMRANMFAMLVPPILSLLEGKEEQWLTIGYQPERDDGISAIQVCKGEDDYYCELVMHLKNGREFDIYQFNTKDLSIVTNVFYYVCVCYECPFEVYWKEINGKRLQMTDAKVFNGLIQWTEVTDTSNYIEE